MSATMALALLPLATSALSAGGQYFEEKSKANAADYNARTAEWQARLVKQSSDFAMARIQRQKAKFLSTQQSLYAKAGVKMEGSPIKVMADSATEYELDKLTENYNAQVQMAALKSEAQASRTQAAQYRFQGAFQPAMTLLTGAANAGMSYAAAPTPKTPTTPTGTTPRK